MRIDHLVYGTRDLASGLDDISALVGEVPQPGGRHPSFGTRNHLLGLGGSVYLEVIGPDPDAAPPSDPRPFGLDDLDDDRLVAWAVATDDMNAGRALFAELGISLGDPFEASRRQPDGTELRWRLSPPVGGVIPFLIDWGESPHPTAELRSSTRLAGLRIETPNADEIKTVMRTAGLDVDVRPGFEERLVATVDAPMGRVVIW